MIQNVKVDIIYFKTQTDFEMEFNLSGCCRMRLLTDKAPNKKILINQLVRAVSRSKIIMITGSLFGEDSIIETASKAISKPIEKLDNAKFGIDENEHIEIIKDSIPLVSSDGIFGGCIIEQGPQTLILLSDNKNIRKNIMNNLIHSYIKELCEETSCDDITSLPTEMQPIDTENEEVLIAESEETLELPEEEILPLVTDEDEIDEEDLKMAEALITDFEEPLEAVEDVLETNEELSLISEEETLPLIIEEEEIDEEVEINGGDLKMAESLVVENEQDYIPMEPLDSSSALTNDLFVDVFSKKQEDLDQDTTEYHFKKESEMFITDEDEDNKPKLWTGLNIPIIILAALLAIIIFILIYSIFIFPSRQGISTSSYLKETYDILFS